MNPIVSVIIPTTHDRRKFNEDIFNNFCRQTYIEKELIWDYEEGTIGEKRNRLCARAKGEIICHMDSDDKYADDWIERSVREMQANKCHITGLSQLNFYDPINQAAYQYTYPDNSRLKWVAGATMCYLRDYWEANPFDHISHGEDGNFVFGVRKRSKPIIHTHDYIQGFVATVHEGNTSRKAVGNVRYRRMGEQEEQEIRRRFFGAGASAII